MYSGKMQKLELSIAIRVKVEVTLSNWNFGFQLTSLFVMRLRTVSLNDTII
jgi:hypothetical protein